MTIPDERLVEDVIRLLRLGSAKTSRGRKRTSGLAGQDVELYRKKTTGKLIYVSIDRRDLLYVAKELPGHMQKPRRVDMELSNSFARYLAGRKRVGTIVGAGQRSGSPEVVTASDWQVCPDTRKRTSGWSRA